MIQFLNRNFYHHESLVYFADFLRLQGRFTDSADFLERCLYAYETSFSFDFHFVQQKDSNEKGKEIEIDLRQQAEPLNRTFCECLVKYIDILGRKGCNRTALEYCKFLLALSPLEDPYGVLLRFDFYAIRAKECELYLEFSRDFCNQFHDGADPLVIFPNFMLSNALAKHAISDDRTEPEFGLKQLIEL